MSVTSVLRSSKTTSFSVTDWRQQFLNLLLRGASIVGLFVALAASLNVPAFLAAVYIGAYIAVLILTFAPLSYRVRAIGFLLVLYVIAISGLLETGIRVDARLFFMTMTLIATMLFGTRSGIISIGIGVATIAVAGYFVLTGRYTLISTTLQAGTLDTWIVQTLVLVMLETVLLIGLTRLRQGFDGALHQAQDLYQAVLTERASLERRVEERTAQIKTSAEVGRAAVSILDTNQLLREIVNLITDRFGFYYAAVFLADQTNKWAVLREATGEAGRVLKERRHQLEIGGQSMVGSVMKTRRARIALDVGDEAVRFANPLLPRTRSEIALPLVVGTRAIGALDVQSTHMAAFDDASAAVLQSMADQIAIALSNTLQFQQAQAALQRTRQLYDASTAVSNAKDAGGILDHLMTTVVPDASTAQILTYGPQDEAGQYVYLEVAAHWTKEGSTPILPIGSRLSPEQLPPLAPLAGEPYVMRDAADPAISLEHKHFLEAMQMRALLGYALIAGSQPVGLLLIAYHEPHMFTPAETQSLQAMAGQIAVTLRNQQLVHEQLQARQELDEINRRLTGQVWEQYVRTRGQSVRKTDVGAGAPQETSARLPSELSAPVLIHGQEIGELRVEDAAPSREWTSNEKALLQAVAGEVAIAIENARLIEQTERRAQRETRLNQIALQLRQTTDIGSILQTAAEQVSLALDTSHAQAQLGTAQPVARQNGGQEALPDKASELAQT